MNEDQQIKIESMPDGKFVIEDQFGHRRIVKSEPEYVENSWFQSELNRFRRNSDQDIMRLSKSIGEIDKKYKKLEEEFNEKILTMNSDLSLLRKELSEHQDSSHITGGYAE